MKRVVVIGAGASGLTAAYYAALNNNQVTVIEKNEKPARKLMITGKGRCNVTNNCSFDALIANTPGNGKFLYSAFSQFGSDKTMELFEKLGVPLKTERGNRVFPISDKACDIVDALVKGVKSNGVKIIHNSVKRVLIDGENAAGVELDDGETIPADSVIIATGGKSYPLTGSTGDGYIMAAELGHTVKEIRPSLVPLEIHEGFCTKLSGLSLKNVTLSVYEGEKSKPIFSELGEMLFTHFGISGPLVLSASAHIRNMGKKSYTAVVDLKPALTTEQLDRRIQRDFSEEQNKDFSNSLDKLLPKSIIPTVVSLSCIEPDKKVNQISREERSRLCRTVKNFTMHITSFRPIEEAVITAGGVSVKEINPSTMESKVINGLFFAGEVIDVDASTGGFNLQIAFATGYLAGINS